MQRTILLIAIVILVAVLLLGCTANPEMQMAHERLTAACEAGDTAACGDLLMQERMRRQAAATIYSSNQEIRSRTGYCAYSPYC